MSDSSVGRLLGGVKKLKIDDQDSSTPSRLGAAFPNWWRSTCTTSGQCQDQAKLPIVLFSDVNLTEDRIGVGGSNGDVAFVHVTRPLLPTWSKKTKSGSRSNSCRNHRGLSTIVCSKTRPEVVYSASVKDGRVCLWDFRESGDNMRPSLSFSVGSSRIGSGCGVDAETSTSQRARPILCLDISSGDQVLCAGTELVGEDSFVLFWDVRIPSGGGTGDKLLGAYWESHSDDVTSVRFHPEKFNSLATGSTDGLLNVFDLLQSNEDDALTYSFNTESSIESIHWSIHPSLNALLPNSCLTCVTHCNQVQIWDADSGDKFVNFDRTAVAQAMMRSNPDAAFVNKCYRVKGGKTDLDTLGLLTCSLKGSCTRFVTIQGKQLEPNGLFLNQNALVQTAEYISNSNRWITFDEEGSVRVWTGEKSCNNEEQPDETLITNAKRRKKDAEQKEKEDFSTQNEPSIDPSTLGHKNPKRKSGKK